MMQAVQFLSGCALQTTHAQTALLWALLLRDDELAAALRIVTNDVRVDCWV